MHQIPVMNLQDIRPAGYLAILKAGYQITEHFIILSTYDNYF